ncbi:hypothetical protein V501_03334 [Pseudogymnoascus sp. VKM F-4519 (FW-2642)]|nr:hypothetical protein V501_03334 [Pseudogymnoascus sp. VKM F-4519 (FW-2642)]
MTRGVATAALTLPESAAKGSARVRAVQQRFLRRMQSSATPDDPEASRPFARERDSALHAPSPLLPADGVSADLGVVRASIRAGAGRDAPSIPGAGVSGVRRGTVRGRCGSRSVGSLLFHGVVEGAPKLGAGSSEDDGEPEEGSVALP